MGEYTREEEIALFSAAQAGDRESVADLMRRHEGLVHQVVQRQWSGGWRYAEVVHEGRIGLWQAILKYDPQRGVAFSTYAGLAIARQVWAAVAARVEPGGVGLVCWDAAGGADLAEQVLARRIEQVLRGMVASLPVREAWVVGHYYGLGGQTRSTQPMLAARLGVTRQAIHACRAVALRRLRHPAWSGHLRALLEYNRRADYWAALRPPRRRR
jgi:RNA polymerase sigma factor (sigma-70 family)